MEIETIKNKAEALREMREKINAIEEEQKSTLQPFKEERDAIQNELVAIMKEAELASVKVSSGESFALASRKSLIITDEVRALSWAKDNHCFSVNKVIATQRLKKLEELPTGFKFEETEYISVRKPKEELSTN